jgi:hypothetical protein
VSKVSDYINNRMDELIGEEECYPAGEYIETVAEEVRNKFNVQCDTCECGGFDSPGYEITCYAMAWINENGELEMQDFQQECY